MTIMITKYKRELQILLICSAVLGLYLTLVLKQASLAKSIFKSQRHQLLSGKKEQEEQEERKKPDVEPGEKIYVDPRHDYAWRKVLSETDMGSTEAVPPLVVII